MSDVEISERLLVVEQVVACERCELHTKCSGPVPFSGPEKVEVAVVGEAPGAKEDEAGQPFVGPAGQHLREALRVVGFDVDSFAFINTASCYPGDVKTPQSDHVAACRPNKLAQIDLVDPVWVLAVGKTALQAERDLEIGRGRGRPWLEDDRVWFSTYHPAAALRNGVMNRGMREDLERFKEMVDAGRDQWETFILDKCSRCSNDMFLVGEDGLTWCLEHAGPAGEARKRVLEQDQARARAGG